MNFKSYDNQQNLLVNQQNRPSTQLNFISTLFQIEEQYILDRSGEGLQKLIQSYCDFIYYFDTKRQEISKYFQAKMKKLIKDLKKTEIQIDVQKQLSSIDWANKIHQQIIQQKQQILTIKSKVMQSILQQKENIINRKLLKRKHLSLSNTQSQSQSIDSLFNYSHSQPYYNKHQQPQKYFQSLKTSQNQDTISEKLSF